MINKKGMSGWIWVLIIVIIIALGIGAYLLLGGGSEQTLSLPSPPDLPVD